MRLVVNQPGKSLFRIAAILLAALCAGQEARANVFASNIKLNGGLSSITNSASPVTIGFILNEPATLGTTINILSGATVVDTISVAAGNPGTLKGTNALVWGATNSGGSSVGGGIYSVSITPAASGYTNWMQITSDTNPGNYVSWPAGIAVDCNPNSLYYGRVMVANSGPNDTGTNYGDTNGIIKLNADASFADEGQSNAGYAFISDGFLGDIPRHGRIGADDRFYFNDWSSNGKIVAVDMLMTTNQVIIDSANFTLADASGNWPEFDVTDVGTTNARVYLSDENAVNPQGIWSWPITNNGAADPTDDGVQVVHVDGNGTPGTDIPGRAVFGLMLDENKDIFLGNVQAGSGAEPRATCITNWPGSTNQPLNTNNILWQVGQNDNTFNNIADLAIDSRVTPHYVAYAMSAGLGGLRILNAATGTLVTNIQQDSTNLFISAAWDNVGNVYAGCTTNANGPGLGWRAFSPPGTNQSTTVAVETIQVVGSAPLIITSITTSNGTIIINFTGSSSDTPSSLAVLSSSTALPASGYSVVGGATIVQVSSGVFQASVPMSGPVEFYRIKRTASAPPTAPTITSINLSSGTVTINFIGSASDPATAFTLMSCGTEIPASSYAAAAGAKITLVNPGVFQATVAASGSMQFYRLKR